MVRRMQTYLELKGQDASQLHTSSNQAVRPTSLQKTPIPKKAIEKRQRKKRSKMPIRKQFKARLIEKPPSNTMKLEATATNATATQTPVTKPTATSIKWPTASIPLTVHNIPTAKIQEVSRSSMHKPQGGEVPLIDNQNTTFLQPRAPATALAAIPLTRDDTPEPKTVLTSTNLFVANFMAYSPEWESNPDTSLY